MNLELFAPITAYLLAAFVSSALFIRFSRRTRLTKLIRKHFYLFPFLPVTFAILAFLRLAACIALIILDGLRFLFEKLSGKKTYRRKSNYYR